MDCIVQQEQKMMEGGFLQVAVKLENLTAGYRRHAVLKVPDMEIPSGTLVAMVGRNGSGKSTLMRTMAGLLPAVAGRVSYDGIDIASLSARDRAGKVSFVNTEKIRVGGMTCHDMVALGRSPYTDWKGSLTSEDECAVMKALSLVGMADFAGRKTDSISDGECQMVSIARAIAQDTPVMMLDEPTAFLDFPNRCKTASILKGLSSSGGKTVIWSTHEIALALEYSDYILTVSGSGVSLLPSGSPVLDSALSSAFGTPPTYRQQR